MTTSTPPPVRPRSDDSRPQPPGRRRSRARTLVPLAVAAWAVLEIWLMVVVADATSGLLVVLLLVAGLVLGATAVKRAGRSAWRNLAASVSAQQAGEAPDAPRPGRGGRNGLAMLGGLLLMVPGFVSDAVALFLLFPPTRKVVGAFADRAAARALRGHGVAPDAFTPPAGGAASDPSSDGKVIQGEVIHRD